MFLVAKGPNRGQPLTAAGLRTIFRYHRARAGLPAGHPHAPRHSFGTALAEAADPETQRRLPRVCPSTWVRRGPHSHPQPAG
jgi:integrase